MDDKIKTLRDALEWLDRRIREEAEYDGEMSNEHAIELAFIQNMLAKFPLRQCDVGTPEEQKERFDAFCDAQPRMRNGCDCNLQKNRQGLCEGLCEFAWAQMPYSAEEGGVN